MQFGFRSAKGKPIIAYWLAAHSVPGGAFAPLTISLSLENAGIQNPVLIDVVSGEIIALHWKSGTTNTLEALPLRDSIFAIADANYFDWPVLPEAQAVLSRHNQMAASTCSGNRMGRETRNRGRT